jgi:peptidyl-prolyl cis-trans isomerase SurA
MTRGILMRRILSSLLLICLAALPALSADKPADKTTDNNEIVEQIVARVNNQIITSSEFQRSKDDLRQEVQQQDAADADKQYADREKDVLRDLIDQQLLLQKGQDLGITAETEVIKKLDDMRKQMHLDSMEALEKAAEAQGISFEDFKQNLKNQIITQQVIGREVGSKMNITKEEEEKYYQAHKSELEHPEQIRLSEILISTEKSGHPDLSPNDAELAAAKAKADDLLAQIRKGASFGDIAKKNSNGPSAAQGGDLGYFKRGTLAKELETLTFGMKAGEVSNVIRTRQGFVILKVTEHQQAGVPSFQEIEPRVQDAVYMERLQPALRAYLTKLREDAFIDIKPGYTDSGASPNETKPVETTTAPEAASKHKKKRRLGIL